MNKHLALIWPYHSFSTRDCAIGYSKALNKLGVHVTDIHSERIWNKWGNLENFTNPITADQKRQLVERVTGDVILEVLKCQPDIAIVIDGTMMHDMFWHWMDRLHIPTAVIMTDCPYLDKANAYVAERCTYPFANDLWSASMMGISYLPMAYTAEIHHPMLVSEKYKSDVVFVGSGFPERKVILEAVDWDGIDFRLFGYWDLENGSPLEPFFKQEQVVIPNPEVAQYYCGTKLVLNIDRVSVDFQGQDRIAGRGSVGPRIYEAAACESVIVSQNTVPELRDLLDDCCLTFDTPQELTSILHEWLADDKAEARNELALGAWEMSRGHSYDDRVIDLLGVIL